VKPSTVREFFALANKHLRWELNEFARKLASRPPLSPLADDIAIDLSSQDSTEAASITHILEAIERLPDEQREVFSLVHIQGLTHTETADVLGVSTKTIQRRLHESVSALAGELSGLAVGDPDDAGCSRAPDDRAGP
jgi:RNA polymerase sigma-70 factor (ECF subfamily)